MEKPLFLDKEGALSQLFSFIRTNDITEERYADGQKNVVEFTEKYSQLDDEGPEFMAPFFTIGYVPLEAINDAAADAA